MPVQPEAMQFEPVDVTDVVNLATGDFVYIQYEQPTRRGLSIVLSYQRDWPNQRHGGLGWTLNAGAKINQGYPDDYKGASITLWKMHLGNSGLVAG